MTVLRNMLVVVILLSTSSIAFADWRAETGTVLGLFYGNAKTYPAALALHCNGQVPGQSLNAPDANLSPTYGFRLEISPPILPSPGAAGRRTDIGLWVNGAGFQLPQMIWSELDHVWSTSVSMSDPMISAMRLGGAIIVGPVSGGQYQVAADNMGIAIEQAMTYCVPLFAQQGHAVPPALAPFVGAPSDEERGGDTLEDFANYHISTGCQNGGFTTDPGYIQQGLIDADADTDFVVDWGKIQCVTGISRPFCGASQCAADLFLSGSFFPEGRPDSFLAQGMNLIDLSNGRKGLQLGGTLSMCNAAGKGTSGCQFIWYWDGTQMQQLP